MICIAGKGAPSVGAFGRIASLFVAGLATACAADGPPDEPLGAAQLALTDGIADNGARPALVRISGCSGVLIASNVILTAAHCIDDYTQNDIPSDPVGPFQGTLGFTVQGLPDQDFQVDNT